MSLLNYFLQAGFVVKLVMLILLTTSVYSWILMVQRSRFFSEQLKQCFHFEERFWNSKELSNLYQAVDSDINPEGLAGFFHKAYREYTRFLKKGLPVLLDPIERAMQVHYEKEALRLEEGLPLFASVGSIAPYVGLFGTVWGIMSSFQALGHAQQATIAMVAPGISEALIATALGLATAIPAVIAYNRFSTRAKNLLDRYQIFQEEILALIETQLIENNLR